MANSPEIKAFIRENSTLFWWIKEEDKENIDVKFLVQHILNYGDEKNVKKLFELVGIDQVADIFYKRTSPESRRINYFPQVKIFLTYTLTKMYIEVLTDKQKELLPLLNIFSKDFI